MKIFMHDDTIINLEEISFIKTINLGYGKSELHFSMKNNENVTVPVKTNEVETILKQIYSIMVNNSTNGN